MKKVKVEAAEPVKTRRKNWWITVQMVAEAILVLNIYHDRILQCRHCINIHTHEYATLRGSKWECTNISTVIEPDNEYYSYLDWKKRTQWCRISEEDEQMVRGYLGQDIPKYLSGRHVVEMIDYIERNYAREKRVRAEANRIQRVNDLMGRIPEIPKGIREWISEKELAGMDFLIRNKELGLWNCSFCGKKSVEKQIRTPAGEAPRNKDMVICPHCKKEVQILKRNKTVDVSTYFALVQPIDERIGVVRHFRAQIFCGAYERKKVRIWEEVRILCNKRNNLWEHRKACDIYYEQYCWADECQNSGFHKGNFDNKSNPANKRIHTGFLYDGGIREAFANTAYERWADVFIPMAAVGSKANYNRLMAAQEDNVAGIAELLFKGRFEKLLRELSEGISYWSGLYHGLLKMDGSSIEEVFGINDRQKINRIREKDGGEQMLEWMQWSDRNRQKIPDKVLKWLLGNQLEPSEMAWIRCRLSMEQAMNYIERQRKESYRGMSARQVIRQYEDYMDMCEKLHKDTSDEMVYRPRELKRRHHEAVAEIERRNAELQAEEYSKKFGEAEKVLGQIREKFEYAGEGFFIKVPERIADIVAEGNYLHHCAAATDRYFDRIKQNETYICFLRKKEEPEIPFYTIEVEPGGTIRQHRGMYDEEPEIETVKPFLKEWQREVRKRMSQEDHALAAVSVQKRAANIEELQAKNNTRVLKGLMEDFMEAVEAAG